MNVVNSTESSPQAPYIKGSATSKSAAVDIGVARTQLQQRVLNFLKGHGPATDEQIQVALGMNPSTQRPRRIELVQAGLVVDSGQKGKTQANRVATLWRAN